MSCSQSFNFLRGKVFASEYGGGGNTLSSLLGCPTTTPMRYLGNVSDLLIKVAGSVGPTVSMHDFSDADTSQANFSSVSVDLVLSNVDKKNLELALFATEETLDESGTTTEKLCASSSIDRCTVFRLKNLGASGLVLTVVDSEGAVIDTLTEGVDYRVSASSTVEFLQDIALPDMKIISATYTYDQSQHYKLQVLNRKQRPISLFFEGVNRKDNTPYIVEIFRLHVKPADRLELISKTSFQNLTLSGVVMKDRKTGRFLTITRGLNEERCS